MVTIQFSWLLQVWRYDSEGDTNLVSFWDFYLFELIFLLKLYSNLPPKIVICFIENPLKMMKNTFCFVLKALFILKTYKFLSWLFVHVEKMKNGLMRKIRLVLKFMTSKPGWKTIATNILPNISRSKRDQTWNLVN